VRLLNLSPQEDGRVAVLEGLAEGEQVVLEGLDRLSEGRAVQVVAEPPAAGAPTTGAPGAARGEQGSEPSRRRRPGGGR